MVNNQLTWFAISMHLKNVLIVSGVIDPGIISLHQPQQTLTALFQLYYQKNNHTEVYKAIHRQQKTASERSRGFFCMAQYFT